MKHWTAFYASRVYDEYDAKDFVRHRPELPDGVYLYLRDDSMRKYWYRKDLTPVLDADVPPELRALLLILT